MINFLSSAKRKTGLYVGSSCAAVVVVENNKVISLAKCDLSFSEEELDSNLTEGVRWDTLINKTLREAKVSEKDIYVSLTDRDFIFRSFEMPLMKKREIVSALSFEIEKYIPFKIDELRWDYRYSSFLKEKKINLSFLGMIKNNFLKIGEIISHLNLNAAVIEPSSLSLARMIKSLPRLSGVKDFALLDYTSSEVHLTFFYQDLPVFNRYIAIPKKETEFEIDKLIESVRLSFLYFRREFKSYHPKKAVILGEINTDKIAGALREDLSIEVEIVSAQDITGRRDACIEHVKAQGAVSRDTYSYAFNPSLMTTKEQMAGGTEVKVSFKIGLIIFFIMLGIGSNFLVSMFLNNKVNARKQQLAQDNIKLLLPEDIKSWSKVQEKIKTTRDLIKVLEPMSVPIKKLSPFLENFPYLFPEGLWLSNLEVAAVHAGYKVILRGSIFMNDSYQERLEIDKFILKLKNMKEVSELFSKVELTSTERRKDETFMVTFFSLILE